jgi:hypothetical protein
MKLKCFSLKQIKLSDYYSLNYNLIKCEGSMLLHSKKDEANIKTPFPTQS